MAAARALDVVRVHGPAGDRGNSVLELRRFVQPVGVQRDTHPAAVGEAQRRVDQLGIRPVVLVDLEAHRAGVDERLERRVVLGSRPGLDADVDRPLR